MTIQPTWRLRPPIRALLIFAGWSLLAVLFTIQGYLAVALNGGNASFVRILIWELPGWGLWGLFSSFIFRLAARFPLDRQHWLKNLFRHILISIPIAFLHISIHASIAWAIEHAFFAIDYSLNEMIRANIFPRISWRILVYFILLIAGHAIAWYRQSSNLENQLVRSQLHALKMQLQPHFLFNTLQSISELMHQDVKAADEMTVRLADFLRLTLDNSGTQEVTLEKELEFVKAYLDIQKMRFGERLTVEYRVQPECHPALVPNLILQPLVENAIRHGIDPQTSNGRIQIEGGHENGRLILRIIDNGEGLPLDATDETYFHAGVGLSNVRARLEQLYGAHFTLGLKNALPGGMIATLEIPYRKASVTNR